MQYKNRLSTNSYLDLKSNLKLAKNVNFSHSWLECEGQTSWACQLYNAIYSGKGGALKIKTCS